MTDCVLRRTAESCVGSTLWSQDVHHIISYMCDFGFANDIAPIDDFSYSMYEISSVLYEKLAQ